MRPIGDRERGARGRLGVAAVVVLVGASGSWAGQHPRLILRESDLPRIRHVVGVAPDPSVTDLRYGARAAELNRLRAYFIDRAAEEALPGELLAAAWLAAVDPDGPARRSCLAVVERGLRSPVSAGGDELARVLAMDWTWASLPRDVRAAWYRGVRERIAPLAVGDSPLDTRVFRERLAWAALALVAGEASEFGEGWGAQRARLVDGMRTWVSAVLPTFAAWRGLSPTSPSAAAREEGDVALALEVAGLLTGGSAWEGAGVSRWLEHYLLVTGASGGDDGPFVRDDGTDAPPTPVSDWGGLDPLTAHLFAVRTRDPSAAFVAGEVEARLSAASGPTPDASDEVRRLATWVPLTLDISGIGRADPRALPVARNLNGAIVFRGGARAEDGAPVLVWIEAAQPCLRRRQHFDAGHFMIRGSGRLLNSSAEDVVFEATPSKGGAQHLGSDATPFDFEQFCTASIAHNCVLVWEPTGVTRWYGREYVPRGGQRPIEGTLRQFDGPLEEKPACTGRLIAYGWEHGAAYAALDLKPAYDGEVLQSYTREFVFAGGGVLVVIDRIVLARAGAEPIAVFQIPERPTVGGADLENLRRVAGASDGGVWQVSDAAAPLRWSERDAALECYSLLPAGRTVLVAGGPARKRVIAEGPAAGRTYVGGSAEGFERLVTPAWAGRYRNAWYELGRPTLLGAQFGRTPIWGRLEVAAPKRVRSTVFATLFAVSRAGERGAGSVAVTSTEREHTIAARLPDGTTLQLVVPAGAQPGGRLRIDGQGPVEWALPGAVQADEPLATLSDAP